MKVVHTFLGGVQLLEFQKFEDERGYFLESYSWRSMYNLYSDMPVTFVQDNHSHSWHNVLRGLHFSTNPQTKLVRVVQGEIFDVVVDVRKNSPTFGEWFATYLTEQEPTALLIPPGIAHGFLVRSDSADVTYKSSTLYVPEYERTLLWNDPDVAVNWGLKNQSIPILSTKDAAGLRLKDLKEQE